MGNHGGAYRAAVGAAAEPLTVDITALGRHITGDLDVKFRLGIRSRLVREDGQVGDAIRIHTNANVRRSPVAGGLGVGGAVPDASFFSAKTFRIDIVLSSCPLAFPHVVVVLVGVGQLNFLSRLSDGGDAHHLTSGIVGTASCHDLVQIVLDEHAAHARDAESRDIVTGQLKHAIGVAKDATNGLAGGTLAIGPLSLLISKGTSIRAHAVLPAALTADGGDDVADCERDLGRVIGDFLNTTVAPVAEIIQSNGSVLGWELGARDLVVRERNIDALATTLRARVVGLGLRGLGRLRRRRRLRRCRGSRGRWAGRLFEELGAEINAGRGGLRRRRRRRISGSRFANNYVGTILQTSASFIGR